MTVHGESMAGVPSAGRDLPTLSSCRKKASLELRQVGITRPVVFVFILMGGTVKQAGQ